MMLILKEGNLEFLFPETSVCTKYDDWEFYRNQFTNVAGGSKGVDFIFIENDCTWLIEVKDYRKFNDYESSKQTKPIDLGDLVAKKMRDTLAGLAAARANASEVSEKAFAVCSLKTSKLKAILHLEQPSKISRLNPQVIDPSKLLMKLKQLLKGIDPDPKVVDTCIMNKHNLPWKVTG